MGTTPNRGFPYPEGTDYVASGDDAIQALAEAVDAALTTRMWATGVNGAEAVAADTPWTLDYASMDAVGFTIVPDGGVAPRFTYTGPTGRWFLVSVGVSIAGPGSTGLVLNLLANGGTIASAVSGADDTHLAISVPVQLTTGTDLNATLLVIGAAGSYDYSWLRAVSL